MADPNKPALTFKEFKSQLDTWKDPDTGKPMNNKQKREATKYWFDKNIKDTPQFQSLSDKAQKDVLGYLNLLDVKADELLQKPMQQQPSLSGRPYTAIDKAKDIVGDYINERLPFANSIKEAFVQEGIPGVGGQIGEMVGTPFGRPVLGAAIGGGVASAGQDIYQGLTGSPRRPATKLGYLAGPISDAAEQALYTKGSDLALRAGKRVFGFPTFAKNAIPDYGLIKEAAEKAGTHLLPDQALTKGFAPKLTGLAEASFSGGRIKRLRQVLQPAALRKRTVDTMMELFGRKDVPAGQLASQLDDVLTGARKTFKDTADEMYGLVSELTKGTPTPKPVKQVVVSQILDSSGKPIEKVTTQIVMNEVGGARVNADPVLNIAKSILEDREFLGRLGATQAGVADLKRILQLKSNMSFSEAHTARSAILDIVRDLESDSAFTGARKPKALRNLNMIANGLTEQMEKAAKDLSPDAHEAWLAARDFYREGQKDFGSKLIRDLARAINNETAERIAPIIFKSGSPEGVKTLLKYIDPPTLNNLRAAYIADKIKAASGFIAGDVSRERTLSGKAFLESLPFGQIDNQREVFDLLFTDEQKKAIKTLGDLAYVMQFKADGSGAVAVQLSQASGAGQIIEGATRGRTDVAFQGGKKILATMSLMDMLAWMMTNPKASTLITESVSAPKGSLNSVTAAIRLNQSFNAFKKAEEKRAASNRAWERSKSAPFSFSSL